MKVLGIKLPRLVRKDKIALFYRLVKEAWHSTRQTGAKDDMGFGWRQFEVVHYKLPGLGSSAVTIYRFENDFGALVIRGYSIGDGWTVYPIRWKRRRYGYGYEFAFLEYIPAYFNFIGSGANGYQRVYVDLQSIASFNTPEEYDDDDDSQTVMGFPKDVEWHDPLRSHFDFREKGLPIPLSETIV